MISGSASRAFRNSSIISVMPKISKPKSSASSSRKEPISQSQRGKGKDSHLYTDDNPATTLHGTGFKDLATAQRTLSLVSERSLTYQFQTINTMYHRASGHKYKTSGMEAAMEVFREWLDDTYPKAKEDLRVNQGFKPVLSKDAVEKWLPRIRFELTEADQRFAEVYCSLKKGARLANVLVKENNPAGRDWEIERYHALDNLVPEGMEKEDAWEEGKLWDEDKQPTVKHLKMIAWAWTPARARKVSK